MKAIEQYFHVVLFTMLYKVVLTLKSGDETQVCDHSNERTWAVLFIILWKVVLTLMSQSVTETLMWDHSNIKNIEPYLRYNVASNFKVSR